MRANQGERETERERERIVSGVTESLWVGCKPGNHDIWKDSTKEGLQ